MNFDSYFSNIKGCLAGRFVASGVSGPDPDGARKWLLRCREEHGELDVRTLAENVFRWFAGELRNPQVAPDVLALLDEFLPSAKQERRDEFAELQRKLAEAENAARERARQESLAAEEAEKQRTARELERESKANEAKLQRDREAQARADAEAERQRFFVEFDAKLDSDFLGAQEWLRSRERQIVSEGEIEQRKINFLRKWFEGRIRTSVGQSKFALDDEQLAAIAAINGNVQVVARAGSGKTAILVNRALFLIAHCRVEPARLLLLAFNRKAANEIRRRLLSLLAPEAEAEIDQAIRTRRDHGGRRPSEVNRDEAKEAAAVEAVVRRRKIALPHVMTFHALAYAIVHPESAPLYDDEAADSLRQSDAIQEVIDAHLRSPKHCDEIRRLMLAHFREDWDRIAAGRHDLSQDEFLHFRRSLPRQTLKGEYVKSHGEKIIANFLFEHGVHYNYEENHWWCGRNYRPDFTIKEEVNPRIVIEYFGLVGDPDYDEKSADKRQYWLSRGDWRLLEFSPRDFREDGEDGFKGTLKTSLEACGVSCRRLSEDEICNRLKGRPVDRFTKAMKSFIGQCRKLSLMREALDGLIAQHQAISDVEKWFLRLAQSIYADYLERVRETGEDDFNGLLQRATEMVNEGETTFERGSGNGELRALRYIFVDEFQDFSNLFNLLLQAIRQQNSKVELFCVGDDWQAINAFAGSDLTFYDRFTEYFGDVTRRVVTTNHRSARCVVEVGNALMAGHGVPARPKPKQPQGSILLVDSTAFEPSPLERERWGDDVIMPMATRLADRFLRDGSNVVFLARRKAALPWFWNTQGGGRTIDHFVEALRAVFPEDRKQSISISTVHGYKGLQQATVIILDVVARCYPLVHPDWAFGRILGKSPKKIIDEERRLLYVALTRAERNLVIITDGGNPSPFLREIDARNWLPRIDWDEFPAISGREGRILIKVTNADGWGTTPTFAIKEHLKAGRFQWDSGSKPQCWVRTDPADRFHADNLKRESWAAQADGVMVTICNEAGVEIDSYIIKNGTWNKNGSG